MLASSLFITAVLLAVVNAATLFAKSEAIRGAGRVVLGLAWLAFGAFLLVSPGGNDALPLYTPLSYLVVASGVITLGSGIRKFARRNTAQ